MRVQIHGGSVRKGVQHVHVRSGGDLVLRYSGSKETIPAADHCGFEVSGR